MNLCKTITRDDIQSTWDEIQYIGKKISQAEPVLANFIQGCILNQTSVVRSISCILANELSQGMIPKGQLFSHFVKILEQNTDIVIAIIADLRTTTIKDPACDNVLTAYLYFKGFHALTLYRLYHKMWQNGEYALARNIHYQCTRHYDVDIHPAAQIGSGIMIDHATGVVIGATAILEDNISILHGVVLGGSGQSQQKRHPTIRCGVLLSTGAKILGDIEVGTNAKVAASSLVLEDVPAHATVAGVPAKVVKIAPKGVPSEKMEHKI